MSKKTVRNYKIYFKSSQSKQSFALIMQENYFKFLRENMQKKITNK